MASIDGEPVDAVRRKNAARSFGAGKHLRHDRQALVFAEPHVAPTLPSQKLLMRRATLMARHSRVNSSIKVISRTLRPSWVCASTKS